MMDIVIIEDEIKTGKELKELIESNDPEYKVIETLRSVISAVTWFQKHQAPDLIFSDIQLGDGLSFDIFDAISIDVPVVFCTAFHEYAIRAFEVNSVDYLLKPIDANKLRNSLEKYKRIKSSYGIHDGRYQTNVSKAATQINACYNQTILVYVNEKIIPIKVSDINLIYAHEGFVFLYLAQGIQYLTNHTMDRLEAMLDPNMFFRVNRSFIVSRNIIESVEHYFNRRLFIKVYCQSPEKILASKTRVSDFLKWITL